MSRNPQTRKIIIIKIIKVFYIGCLGSLYAICNFVYIWSPFSQQDFGLDTNMYRSLILPQFISSMQYPNCRFHPFSFFISRKIIIRCHPKTIKNEDDTTVLKSEGHSSNHPKSNSQKSPYQYRSRTTHCQLRNQGQHAQSVIKKQNQWHIYSCFVYGRTQFGRIL